MTLFFSFANPPPAGETSLWQIKSGENWHPDLPVMGVVFWGGSNTLMILKVYSSGQVHLWSGYVFSELIRIHDGCAHDGARVWVPHPGDSQDSYDSRKKRLFSKIIWKFSRRPPPALHPALLWPLTHAIWCRLTQNRFSDEWKNRFVQTYCNEYLTPWRF